MGAQILKAKNQGKLKIAEKELICAVLEDETRVISRNVVFKAFGRTKRGRKVDEIRVLNMPSFIDANNLQPFISDDLRAALTPAERPAWFFTNVRRFVILLWNFFGI